MKIRFTRPDGTLVLAHAEFRQEDGKPLYLVYRDEATRWDGAATEVILPAPLPEDVTEITAADQDEQWLLLRWGYVRPIPPPGDPPWRRSRPTIGDIGDLFAGLD